MSQGKASTRNAPRRLRVFAFDPTTGRRFVNRDARIVTISLPYELDPCPTIGPKGEYVEVVDYDPASGLFYPALDLGHDQAVYDDGLAPSAENPRFHQQMVYGVTMHTISLFEEALGRVVQWSPRTLKIQEGPTNSGTSYNYGFVKQLRIYPHAIREANAYYDPKKKALLFGYFQAPATKTGAPAGSVVFTCLSHDIIVHETVHAILDGMHPYYAENSSPDMRALHEAFADIIALFQLFAYPEVLEHQIAQTRGDLSRQNLLGELAQELGRTMGHSDALRGYLGQYDDDGEWVAAEPDSSAYNTAKGPHDRGAVLVAAVFGAFLTIYKNTVSDLFRAASAGSGILRPGEIDPDLKKRLASEAAQCARRVMRICIRAMDYTPPVGVTFGCYLRAIITSDIDLFPEDERGYRDAFIESFTAWGIVPAALPVVSETALCWPTAQEAEQDRLGLGDQRKHKDEVELELVQAHIGMLLSNPGFVFGQLMKGRALLAGEQLDWYDRLIGQAKENLENANALRLDRISQIQKELVGESFDKNWVKEARFQSNILEIGATMDREIEFHTSHYYRRLFWLLFRAYRTKRFTELLGIDLEDKAPSTVLRSRITLTPSMDVRSVRIAQRMGQRGQLDKEIVIELTQARRGYFDPEEQAAQDALPANPIHNDVDCDFTYRAGTTLIIDTREHKIRRLIRSPYQISDARGLAHHRAHLIDDDSRPNNAFYGANSACGDAAFTDLHRATCAKDHFG